MLTTKCNSICYFVPHLVRQFPLDMMPEVGGGVVTPGGGAALRDNSSRGNLARRN